MFGPTHRVRISQARCRTASSSGRPTAWGVNAATPGASLDVRGVTAHSLALNAEKSDNSGTIFMFSNTYVDGSDADAMSIKIDCNGNCGTSNNFMTFFNGGDPASIVGQIEGNGTGGISYVATSDARLKENVKDTRYGLESLLRIRVRDYTWKGTGAPDTGLIAQELAEVYPEAVSTGGDNPGEDPWGVSYGRLVPLLIQAVQDQNSEIESLRKQVAALQAANASLQAQPKRSQPWKPTSASSRRECP